MSSGSSPSRKSLSNALHKEEECVLVKSSDGIALETRLLKGQHPRYSQTAVILTHPYGPLGGNLDNNVVYSLFQLFASLGFTTARFNFRGVGHSTGRTSFQGLGEIDDLLSVYKFIKTRSDLKPKHVLLVGYSYGSITAGAASVEIPDLCGFIAISYPSGVSWALTLWNGRKYLECLRCLASPAIPKLLIMGERYLRSK